jgi:hypothetical protein
LASELIGCTLATLLKLLGLIQTTSVTAQSAHLLAVSVESKTVKTELLLVLLALICLRIGRVLHRRPLLNAVLALLQLPKLPVNLALALKSLSNLLLPNLLRYRWGSRLEHTALLLSCSSSTGLSCRSTLSTMSQGLLLGLCVIHSRLVLLLGERGLVSRDNILVLPEDTSERVLGTGNLALRLTLKLVIYGGGCLVVTRGAVEERGALVSRIGRYVSIGLSRGSLNIWTSS